MCCDSAHKTLPVLTGGAYLHIAKNAPQLFLKQAENAMSVFASTSPSYLILQSLDAVNKYISDGYKDHLQNFISNLDLLKQELLTKAIGDSTTKLDALKQAQRQLDEEVKKGNPINQAEYRKLEREIASTEASLSKMKNEVQDCNPKMKALKEGLQNHLMIMQEVLNY